MVRGLECLDKRLVWMGKLNASLSLRKFMLRPQTGLSHIHFALSVLGHLFILSFLAACISTVPERGGKKKTFQATTKGFCNRPLQKLVSLVVTE